MPVENRKQAGITRSAISKFEAAIANAKRRPVPEDTHPIMWKAYQEGMESQLETLRRELHEFEVVNGAGGGGRTRKDAGF